MRSRNRGKRDASRVARRATRRAAWEARFSPWTLAAAGAAVSIAFLFQRSISLRTIMFACFLGAAWLSGKKISIPATVFVSLGIVLANLLVPVGKVLCQLGPLVMTQGALEDGIGKALVFEGLIYISKASILPSLKLPGRFGALVASSFVYYDRIVEYKGSVRPAHIIEDADALMLELWDEALGAPLESDKDTELASETRSVGGKATVIALAAVVIASYGLLFLK